MKVINTILKIKGDNGQTLKYCLKFNSIYRPVKGTNHVHQKLWAQCTLGTS